MINLVDDAQEYKDECRAFPFENYLSKLKGLVHTGNNPLVQIVKRLGEMNDMST